ncbi:MAG: SpoIIE family protein phosphatase [Candidatus Aminicenantaceae bacterium]
MKILVIQNTPAIKNLLLETLGQKENELTFATDSNDALRLIKKRKDIRIVIAELNMPGMNGIELCKQIRSAEFPYYIYIILMTSKNHKSEVIKGIKEGADDILTKPIDPDELQIRVLAGERIVHLEEDLIEKNKRLHMANEILRGNLVSGQEAQKSLLPSGFPDVSNMKFAASFIPSAFGSGDIYNIFRLDEKNIGLYNIDVSGHGVSAALFSVCLNQRLSQGPQSFGLVKAPLTAPPFYHINSPVKVVTSLDEEDMLGKYGRYFTMVYAIVNVETGGISFYRAGHNYPLLIHNKKNSCYIEGGGPPIGLGISLSKKREQDIKLEAGDQLIFFSDGINDAFSPRSRKRYGLERARKILTKHYPESLERSFDRLISDVQKFIGQDGFSDDISIIGFKWLGSRVN